MAEIGCQDATWLRINQVTAKNIYSPRYFRGDAGMFVDGTTNGIDGSGGARVLALGINTAKGPTGEIRATGNITAYYSDERLKEKIKSIEDAVTKLKQLNGFYYKNNEIANENGYTDDEVQVGLSAQEVQQVFPEIVKLAPFDSVWDKDKKKLVSKSGENYMTLDYSKLIPVLIEAIKELSERIEKLENKS